MVKCVVNIRIKETSWLKILRTLDKINSFCKLKHIRRDSNITEFYVRSSLNKMEKLGWVVIKRNNRGMTHVRITPLGCEILNSLRGVGKIYG